MTEAGRKWVMDIVGDGTPKQDPDVWGFVHPLSSRSAEFWLRAFCYEVESLAKTKNVGRQDTKTDLAFRELKRQLLGEP